MAVKLRVRRDTASNWASANPVLDEGEIGYETDTGNLKVGDGATAWIGLAYHESGGGDMLKATYDADDDGRVDDAEQLADGTNTVTAAQARTHIDDTANPHGVTAAQASAIPSADEGVANGVATLDGNVRVVEPAVRVEEEVATDADSTATHAFDLDTGTVFQLTLTANCTVSFANVPAGGFGITIELIQDATGSRTVTWPAAVTWADGTAPTLSTAANAVDVVALYTPDGGTTWRGFLAGLAFA